MISKEEGGTTGRAEATAETATAPRKKKTRDGGGVFNSLFIFLHLLGELALLTLAILYYYYLDFYAVRYYYI